jgi:hypothetical protein
MRGVKHHWTVFWWKLRDTCGAGVRPLRQAFPQRKTAPEAPRARVLSGNLGRERQAIVEAAWSVSRGETKVGPKNSTGARDEKNRNFPKPVDNQTVDKQDARAKEKPEFPETGGQPNGGQSSEPCRCRLAVTVHGPAGDWSAFRLIRVVLAVMRRPKTRTCPLSSRRG